MTSVAGNRQVTRSQPDIGRSVALEGAETDRCVTHHADSGRMQLATARSQRVYTELTATQTRFGYQYRLQRACIMVIEGKQFSVIAGADYGGIFQRPGLMRCAPAAGCATGDAASKLTVKIRPKVFNTRLRLILFKTRIVFLTQMH